MKRHHFIYSIIIVSVLIMIYNIYELDFNKPQGGSIAGIASNIFLILAMIISIKDLKKKDNS